VTGRKTRKIRQHGRLLLGTKATHVTRRIIFKQKLDFECRRGIVYTPYSSITYEESMVVPHNLNQLSFTSSNVYQVHLFSTIKGWKFLVVWTDGTSDWIPLRDMKETCPLQTANMPAVTPSRTSQHLHGGSLTHC
jgi:hypothetical protein